MKALLKPYRQITEFDVGLESGMRGMRDGWVVSSILFRCLLSLLRATTFYALPFSAFIILVSMLAVFTWTATIFVLHAGQSVAHAVPIMISIFAERALPPLSSHCRRTLYV